MVNEVFLSSACIRRVTFSFGEFSNIACMLLVHEYSIGASTEVILTVTNAVPVGAVSTWMRCDNK